MLKQEVLLVVLVLNCLNFLYFASSENVQLFRYTKAECSSSNRTVVDYYCYIKAYSRTLTTLSNGGRIIKNHTTVYLKQTMEYKYGTVFREVMVTPRIEVCEVLERFFGKKTKFQRLEPANIIFNMTYHVIKDSLDLKHRHLCPIYGTFAANSISMKDANFFSIFPSGEYRVTVFYSNEDDPKIFEMKFWHTVKSSIKTSF